MADKYDKLERMRADIQRDQDKVAKLQEQIKQKEARLKEAESLQIVADVGAMNMSPEQLGQLLELIGDGGIEAFLDRATAPASVYASRTPITNISEDSEDSDDEI